MGDGVLERGLFFALLAWVVARNLPGALLFVRPAFRRSGVLGGPDAVVADGLATTQMLEDLRELGFRPLGVRWEQKPFARRQRELVLAADEERAYACLTPVQGEPWLYFFTAFRDGGTVITADFAMDGVDEADHQAGGLPGHEPAEVLAAHRRRVKRWEEAGRQPDGELSLEGRLSHFRRFYGKGPGRRDTRRRELRKAVLTAVALFVAGKLVKDLLER